MALIIPILTPGEKEDVQKYLKQKRDIRKEGARKAAATRKWLKTADRSDPAVIDRILDIEFGIRQRPKKRWLRAGDP